MARRSRIDIPEDLLKGAKTLSTQLPDEVQALMPRKPSKPQSKAKTVKPRPKAKPTEPVELAEPGKVIAEGTVIGRAIPWKSPTISKHGGIVPTRDYKKYEAWKADIASQVAAHKTRRCPYGGPVRLDVTFYLKPTGRTWPDRSNCLKAYEDALQGILIVNDRQICDGETKRVMDATEAERVEYRIVAVA